MLAPSDEFIDSLPGGRVPDRNDFLSLDTRSRIRQWRQILDRCRVLADEWRELIESGGLSVALEPFPA